MNEPTPGRKRRQILAWILIILLLCLYLLTLAAAIFDHSDGRSFFKFCMFCSLVFPILLYLFFMLSKLKK